jgi:hypothetical protein
MEVFAGLENREYGGRDPSRWPRGTLYPQKLAITSLTSGGRSFGIVRSWTQTTEFVLLMEIFEVKVLCTEVLQGRNRCQFWANADMQGFTGGGSLDRGVLDHTFHTFASSDCTVVQFCSFPVILFPLFRLLSSDWSKDLMLHKHLISSKCWAVPALNCNKFHLA